MNIHYEILATLLTDYLDISNVMRLCQVNKYFNQLNNDSNFWEHRLLLDFNEHNEEEYCDDPKDTYIVLYWYRVVRHKDNIVDVLEISEKIPEYRFLSDEKFWEYRLKKDFDRRLFYSKKNSYKSTYLELYWSIIVTKLLFLSFLQSKSINNIKIINTRMQINVCINPTDNAEYYCSATSWYESILEFNTTNTLYGLLDNIKHAIKSRWKDCFCFDEEPNNYHVDILYLKSKYLDIPKFIVNARPEINITL